MRTWLYDRLTTDASLQADLGGVVGIRDRVMPRRSQTFVPLEKPFMIYGLGNSTDEELSDSTSRDKRAERQFFQVWVHDVDGTYLAIDNIIPKVIARLHGASHPPSRVLTTRYLETSQEFGNETYGTIFRYIRFQAIITQEGNTP